MRILKMWIPQIYCSLYKRPCKGKKKTKNNRFRKWIKKLDIISLDNANNSGKYNSITNELDAIYDHIAKPYKLEANAIGMTKNQKKI